MAYAKHYGSGAANSSANEKQKTKSGTPYTDRSPYDKDMYDAMAPMNRTASGKTNNSIQGSTSKVDAGSTGDQSQKVAVKGNDGSKDYGKGNPYQSPAAGKGAKPNNSAKPVSTKKQDGVVGKAKKSYKSLAELKELASSL